MRTTRWIILLAALPLASAKADSILGVYAGVQGWGMSTEGGFANNNDIQPFSFDDETQFSFHIAVEHPVPLIPNVKVRRTSLDTQGDVNLTQSFNFGDQLFTANSNIATDIDATHTDLILYYEVFDNNLFSFDFGLNGKYVEGDLIAQDLGETTRLAAERFSGVVPLLYSRIQIGVPFTGWGAYAEGSYLSIDDNTLYDYQVALTYAVVESLAVDVGFELGYRSLRLELDDVDDITTDLDFDGVFAGIEIHF
jgi:outer membrane protein